jgi:hypothetical protein
MLDHQGRGHCTCIAIVYSKGLSEYTGPLREDSFRAPIVNCNRCCSLFYPTVQTVCCAVNPGGTREVLEGGRESGGCVAVVKGKGGMRNAVRFNQPDSYPTEHWYIHNTPPDLQLSHAYPRSTNLSLPGKPIHPTYRTRRFWALFSFSKREGDTTTSIDPPISQLV